MKKPTQIFISLIVTLFGTIAQAQSPTLAQLKAKYLNQKITVNTASARGTTGSTLTGWQYADPKLLKKGVYQATYRDLPKSYMEKPGTVIDLRFGSWRPDQPTEQTKVNALGEVVSADDRPIANKKIEYVVRFGDGTVAIGSEIFSPVLSEIRHTELYLSKFELSSVREGHERTVAQNLQSVIGKDLYIPGYATIFPLDATAEELADSGDSAHKSMGRLHLPLLEPAKIVDAKYLPHYELVVLKLKLLDGREVLNGSMFRDHPIRLPGGVMQDDSFLAHISGALLTEIPSTLTPEEIHAIKQQEFFKGMSRTAVEYLRGKPRKESSWGDGGTQLIYKDVSIFLDDSGKVENWNQSIEAY